MKTKRTGQSLVETINNASNKTMITVGFTEAQAARAISTRRVLPLVEDTKQPCIDARKLWEKIGKPHGRFNDWAEYSIKPLLVETAFTTEISVIKTAARGTPRTDYTLSRDVASHLAMMTRTPEGREIRQYFLDMERLALRLHDRQTVRVDALIQTDNALTHHCRKDAGNAAKAGIIHKSNIPKVAIEKEAKAKSLACEIVTGKPAGYWREALGSGRGVRDVLANGDLHQYQQCYAMIVGLLQAGIEGKEALIKLVTPAYGNKVEMDKYLTKVTA